MNLRAQEILKEINERYHIKPWHHSDVPDIVRIHILTKFIMRLLNEHVSLIDPLMMLEPIPSEIEQKSVYNELSSYQYLVDYVGGKHHELVYVYILNPYNNLYTASAVGKAA